MKIARLKVKNEIMIEICDSLFSNNEKIKKSCSKTILPIKPEIVDIFF